MTLKGHAKFKVKLTRGFGKLDEEFGNFSSEHLKVPKLGLCWDPFV